ncbi:MAG: hypothetical protein ACI4L9_03350, partial [Candidatus Coproplasma sp.]
MSITLKNKILKLLLTAALSLFLAITPIIAVFASGSSGGFAVASEGEPVTVSIRAKTEVDVYGSKVAMFDSSNKVYFYIEADKAPLEPITVYYRTEDMSAVAAAGDYDAFDGSVTLTKDKPQVLLSVQTYKESCIDENKNLVTRTSKYDFYEGKYEYYYLGNMFRVMIYRVEGTDASVDAQASNILAYKAFSEDKAIDLQYVSYGTDIGRWTSGLGGADTWTVVGRVRERIHYTESPVFTAEYGGILALDNEWSAVYVNNGLGAMYVSMDGEIDERGYHDEKVYTQI